MSFSQENNEKIIANLNAIPEKNKSSWRWAILVLGCFMMIGSYYCYDIPAALKTQIDDYMGDPSDYELRFSLLYTLYAAPNVIIPFFGGYLVDKFGVRSTLLVFSSLITLGQLIFTIGLSLKSWPLLYLGRLVFGLGGESFTVANCALLSSWFKGTELAFSFGINLSISRLGSVFNNILSPALTSQVDIQFALWFGTILCAACVGLVLVTIPIDLSMDSKIEAATRYVDRNDSKNGNAQETSVIERDTGVKTSGWRDVLQLSHVFWVLVVSCIVVYGCVLPFNNISSSLLLERDYFKATPNGCSLEIPNQCPGIGNEYENCPSSNSYQPPLPTNYTTPDNVIYNPLTVNDIDCTNDIWKNGCATQEYCKRFDSAVSEVSFIMSIPYIISAVFSPPLGYLVDIYGARAIISALSPLILLIVHLLLALSRVSPIGPLVGQGLAYTGFVSVLWPSIPLVVEEHVTGLAFGVVTSGLNFGGVVIPPMIAAVYDTSNNEYIPNVELVFVAFAAVGLIVGIYLNIYDFRHGNVLNGEWLCGKGSKAYRPLHTDEESTVPLYNPVNGAAEEEEEEEVRKNSADDTFGRNGRNSRDNSVDRQARRSKGSFASYEEALKSGTYRKAK